MNTNLHLVFAAGKCTEAFAFYETVFKSKVSFCMKYGDAPPGTPVTEDMKDLVMHTSMPLGSLTLMGCDAPKHMGVPTFGGFHISVDMPDEDEVKRVFDQLQAGGKVAMPLSKTFWSPLFGMCTDRFGVEWMVSVPGPQM